MTKIAAFLFSRVKKAHWIANTALTLLDYKSATVVPSWHHRQNSVTQNGVVWTAHKQLHPEFKACIVRSQETQDKLARKGLQGKEFFKHVIFSIRANCYWKRFSLFFGENAQGGGKKIKHKILNARKSKSVREKLMTTTHTHDAKRTDRGVTLDLAQWTFFSILFDVVSFTASGDLCCISHSCPLLSLSEADGNKKNHEIPLSYLQVKIIDHFCHLGCSTMTA